MTEEEIYQAFPDIMHRFGKLSADVVFGELTQNEFVALNIIHGYIEKNQDVKGIYVSQLSAFMQTSPPGISRMLRTMEEKGLIERSVDKEDRRNTFVSITEKGNTMRVEGGERLGQLFHEVIIRLGVDKVGNMLNLLTDFVEIMQEETEKLKDKIKGRSEGKDV